MYFSVPKDYADVTGVRHCSISENSGEDFYHKKLNGAFAEAYEKGETLELDLDGSLDGYSPSFIDEAIGNLIYDFGPDNVDAKLVIKSDADSQWLTLYKTKTFPKWKKRYEEKDAPQKTEEHPAWYRLVKGKLELKVWVNVSK